MPDKKSLSFFASALTENGDGYLSGGFGMLLSSLSNTLVMGGQESNNCNGGNCVAGCGANNVAGCSSNNQSGCGGFPTNVVAGCGRGLQVS